MQLLPVTLEAAAAAAAAFLSCHAALNLSACFRPNGSSRHSCFAFLLQCYLLFARSSNNNSSSS
jgi:hypothetical protein